MREQTTQEAGVILYVGALTALANLMPKIREASAPNKYNEVEELLIKAHKEISRALQGLEAMAVT